MRRIAAIVGVLLAGVARATMPVFDASSFAKMVESVRLLEREVTELRSTYQALSGTRGLGDVLYNPALREYLPRDWMQVYDAASGGGYAGISGRLRDVERAERLTGSVAEQVAAIQERRKRTGETDKAIALHAFDGARSRLTQIESLMHQINLTRDPKGIAELQARIQVEQAAVENEATKLQLVAMLQQSEQKLEEEQRREVAARIMSPGNSGMPSCCAAR